MTLDNKNIIQLDYTGMMRSAKNPTGFTKDDLYSLEPEIKKAHKALLQKRKQGDLDFSAKLEDMKGQVPEIQAYADKVANHYENFVLLGMGGSALGPQAVHQALLPYYYNDVTPEKRNQRPRFYVVDNIDPTRFRNLLQTLDLKKTLFNVVSKSGSTSETMALFLIIRELLKEVCGDQFNEHIVVTTDEEKGNFVTIAQKEGYQHFVIPCGIGGRFSELTPVGLLPAAVCGIHISELLEGAITLDELIREKSDLFENLAQLRAAFSYLSLKQGKTISVFMPYADGLKTFADWYAQLWAESLGKRFNRQGVEVCTGQTPVKALGVTDQHSQMQLYTEGPNDKIFTFVTVEKLHEDIRIPKDPNLDQSLQFLGDHGLGELLQAEFTATEYALTLAGRLHQNIRMPELSAYTVGQLILLLEWETAYMGELLDINAFDQPGVEEGKIGTYALMGRPGYEQRKAEIEGLKKERFVL